MLEVLFPAKLDARGLADIQAMVVRFYRLNYAKYIFLHFDDAAAGRKWIDWIRPAITSAAAWDEHSQTARYTWNIGLTYPGLQALGLAESTLHTFAAEFREGMAPRAGFLGDTGDSAPAHWQFGADSGAQAIHALLVLYADDATMRTQEEVWLQEGLRAVPGVHLLYEQDAELRPGGREHFGYRDGIGQPVIENSGVPPLPGQGAPVATGEFIMGYPDETHMLPPTPKPDVLGRHGSYLIVRKLYEDVAAFRACLETHAAELGIDVEHMAAKLMGRWRSGAPLVLCPDHDDPELGADPLRNNNFAYLAADPDGVACPHAAHMRRAYARDQKPEKVGGQQRHRILRVGVPYGPDLPDGALDDGTDRGIIFVFVGASIERQFEFVQTAWINDGDFLLQGTDRDPIAGANDGTTEMVIPWHPIRYRIKGVPRFVSTRGGGYFFMPSLTALCWLADPAHVG